MGYRLCKEGEETMSYLSSEWWEKEIKRRSKSLREKIIDVLKSTFLVVMSIFSILAAINLFISINAWSETIFKISSIINGICGISISSIYEIFGKKVSIHTRYLRSALSIINELEEQGKISSSIANKIRSKAQSILIKCTDPETSSKEAEELLKQFIEEIPKIYKTKKQLLQSSMPTS